MKKNQWIELLQNKLVLAALLMVLVAGTAMAGVMALRNDQEEQQDETKPGYAFQTEGDDQGQLLEKPEDGLKVDPEVEASDQKNDGLVQLPDNEKHTLMDKVEDGNSKDQAVQSDTVDAVIGSQGTVGEMVTEGNAAETLVSGDGAVIYEPETEAAEAAAPGMALDFQAGSTIEWPVFGNIVLDYSMDSTIYFPTLEQYKCNPGILIQAEVGQTVNAAVRGEVTEVGWNEEIGNYIMMDLGGEYSILYGQLEEIRVSVGEMVEIGRELGVVALPTKYYVVEGPNVYLELRHQQVPVDPLDYIR